MLPINPPLTKRFHNIGTKSHCEALFAQPPAVAFLENTDISHFRQWFPIQYQYYSNRNIYYEADMLRFLFVQ